MHRMLSIGIRGQYCSSRLPTSFKFQVRPTQRSSLKWTASKEGKMLPSPETQKRTLSIDTGSPTAEIFVIDSNNTVVARGVQSLEQSLPVGIYKVRFRIGNTVADKLFELPTGEGFYTPPELPELPLVSPVPLTGPMSQLASTWSTTVHVSYGKGSRIFLFVDASPNPSQPITPGNLILRRSE